MAGRRKRYGRTRELATVGDAEPYDALTDGIARLLAPVIQEGLRRGIGLALGNTRQVANGGLLVGGSIAQDLAPSLGAFNSSFMPNEVKRLAPADGGSKCKAEGCPNDVRCKGLCSKHYQVVRRVERGAPRRVARVHPNRATKKPRRPDSQKSKPSRKPDNRKAPRAKTVLVTAPESKAAA